MVNRNAAQELKKLRTRFSPKFSMRRMAQELGYADGSSYQRYEDPDAMADKGLPFHVAMRIITNLEGKGDPPINREEILALVGDTNPGNIAQIPLSVGGIRVEGVVAAGVWREADFPWEPGGEHVPASPDPAYRGLRQFAVRVEGPSVNKEIPDGEYAICISFPDLMREPRDGDLVVVQRSRDGGLHEYTIKRLRMPQEGLYELWPESTHSDYQSKLSLGSLSEHTEIAVIGLVVGKYAPV